MNLVEILVVAIGLPLIMLAAWATDRKDSTFDGLEYGDDED